MQAPEQLSRLSRDKIDAMLAQCAWTVQDYKTRDFLAGSFNQDMILAQSHHG